MRYGLQVSLDLADAVLELYRDNSGTYLEWLDRHFRDVAVSPFADRHRRLWEWFSSLRSAETRQIAVPTPRVEVWPRGGGKSATAELACAFAGVRLLRRFILYVSETQGQADSHVQTIARYLERLNVSQAISARGNRIGWRRSQIMTARGFTVAAYGLDCANRGIKVDRFRPDLIIFDDIDSQADSAATVAKKIRAITTAILPMGAPDCAILFLQNLIHEEGVVAQLVDGRADFLLHRDVPPPDPAVRGLVTEIVKNKQGANVHAIVAGEATWEGQPLSTCERQINDWGLRAFLREAQHEVQNADGYFFDVSKFEIVDDAPSLVRVCVAWDLAATEGGGDHTAAVLMGRANNGLTYVIDVLRGQHSSERVRELIHRYARRVHNHFPNYTIRLPQDPGQAGKDQADQLRRSLAEFRHVRIEPPTGPKSTRAGGYAEQVNLGNVKLIKGEWNAAFIEEHRKFREDESHEFDDQIDAASDAFNELAQPGEARQTSRIFQSQAHGRQFSAFNRWADEGEHEDDDD